MRNPAARGLLAVVLAAALLTGAGIASADSGSIPSSSPDSVALDRSAGPTQVAPFERPPETTIRIDLRPDRDAEWTVTVRYTFTDANETIVFETVSNRFLDGEIGPTETLYENFAAGANTNVDREMAIVDLDRTVEIHDDVDELDVSDDVVAVGELHLEFVWTEFLATDGEDLVLGDALTTPTDGTWLRSLSEGQSIEVKTPTGYSVSGTPGATVPLRDNAVVIDGPRAFDEDERVAVVYSPTGTPDAPPWTMLAIAIVVAAVLIGGGLFAYRRSTEPNPGLAGTDAVAADPSATAGSETANGGIDHEGSTADPEAAATAATVPPATSGPDLSLLSDEERVEHLLVDNGGRMRQADIVAETAWSDAKVSQLLSAMASDGRVEKLRLGRENLISLPDDAEISHDGDGANTTDSDANTAGDDDDADNTR